MPSAIESFSDIKGAVTAPFLRPLIGKMTRATDLMRNASIFALKPEVKN